MTTKDGQRNIEYAKSLVKKLLNSYELYFSHDVLNSDGRKILKDVIRAILSERPEMRRFLKKIRAKPTLDNIIKLAEALGCKKSKASLTWLMELAYEQSPRVRNEGDLK